MRGLCALALVASLALSSKEARGAEPRDDVVGIFFAPTGAPRFAARVREAFVAGLSAHAISLVEPREPQASEAGAAAPFSPRAALAEGEAAYRAYRFADAVSVLTRLESHAEATGGEGLDARALADIFVYRALARLELKEAGPAWEDFVRAARLDPARLLDAAEFPPRAVAAHRRAIAEATQVPRSELVVHAPPAACVWIDGRAATDTMAVPLGPHFVRVVATGYAPWGALVSVATARVELTPPLVPDAPPGREALLATAPPSARAVLLGAIARGARGEWRFVARREERGGSSVAVEEILADETSAATSARAALDRLFVPARAVVVIDAAPTVPVVLGRAPARRRWWIGALIGGAVAVAVAAIVVPIAVVYGSPSRPSAGGALPQP